MILDHCHRASCVQIIDQLRTTVAEQQARIDSMFLANTRLITELEKVVDSNSEQQARIAQLEEDNKRYLKSCDVMLTVGNEACDRITQLEEALRAASDALAPYMKFVEGTQVKNQAAQAYDKINEVMK